MPTLVETPPQALLERETELETLFRACRDTATGSVIVLRGPAGIGKTALIGRATAAGAASGRWVLAGSGAELERDLAFGVVRQLLEPPLHALTKEQRASLLHGAAALAMPVLEPDLATERPQAMHAALHGLYWLTAELAAIQPLLLAVDDLHWADAPSLRWLAYLGRRLAGVPALLVMTMRDAEPGADAAILNRVLADTRARVLSLDPLSEAGVGRWLTDAYGSPPAAAFVHGCQVVTGGNPFLLEEVTASLRAEGVASDTQAVSHLGGIAPASIAQSVLTRLAPLGADAVAVAEAAAVLSTDARLERVAAIARVPVDRAAEIADRLTAAGILRGGEPLLFRHPVLRSAVYDQTPAAWRALAHLTAAELLLRDADGPERAGTHLLLAPVGGRAWVVDAMRAAGAAAVARGAPDSAVPLLRRAVLERPPGSVDLLLELAAAEATVQDPAGAEHAALARANAVTPEERCRAALTSARALLHLMRLPETIEIATVAEADAPDLGARRTLQAYALLARLWHTGVTDLDEPLRDLEVDGIAGDTKGERLLLMVRVGQLTARGRRRDHALRLAARVLSHEPLDILEHEEMLPVLSRCMMMLGATDEALQVFDGIVERSRSAGAIIALGTGLAMRAECQSRAGRLAEAEADLSESIEIAREDDARLWLGGAVSTLAVVLTDRVGPDAALELLDAHGLGGAALPPSYQGSMVLAARGVARAAAGDHAAAITDLRMCGERQLRWGETGPAGLPWRPALAVSLAAVGQQAEAERLAAEQLRLAREFGAPLVTGRSLHALGLVATGDRMIARLREAEEVLAASPGRLEHARVLLDLGAALRRSGRRVEAREARLGARRNQSLRSTIPRRARSGRAACRGRTAAP